MTRDRLLHYGLLVQRSVSGYLDSYERYLVGTRGSSPKTVLAYLGGVRKLIAETGDPSLDVCDEAYLSAFVARLLRSNRYRRSSVNNYVRSLRPFFAWLVEEGELDEDPMLRIRTPKPDELTIRTPTDDELEAILDAIGERRRDFVARRDAAIVRLFIDSGVRRAELTGMGTGDIEFLRPGGVARVFGKGRRERMVSFGGKTAAALDRYLRVRQEHRYAHLDALWLGEKGALTGEGVYQMVKRRCVQAGVELHPHQFRHWHADQWLAAGGSETGLQTNNGWRSAQMLRRYGASAAGSRALAEGRRLAVGDKL